MINQNGNIVADDALEVLTANRAFKYGDGIFDTLKYENELIYFLEDHYFRLMSSMRMLRMKIPMYFTLEFYEDQINKTIEACGLEEGARIRVNVFRQAGGLYAPKTNEIRFSIEARSLAIDHKEEIEIELFKDFQVSSGLLSTIKTNNRIINVLGSIYAKENGYQNCILINEKKEVVEALNANIFLITGGTVRTPSLETGCINGIVRKKLIEGLKKDALLSVEEASISPFELLKADEVFLTNSIYEIQSVDRYRKKIYKNQKTEEIRNWFNTTIKK